MAKWSMETTRYFMSQFDGVQYVIPVPMQKQWIKWMCSNETALPEWATAANFGNLTFTDPKIG